MWDVAVSACANITLCLSLAKFLLATCPDRRYVSCLSIGCCSDVRYEALPLLAAGIFANRKHLSALLSHLWPFKAKRMLATIPLTTHPCSEKIHSIYYISISFLYRHKEILASLNFCIIKRTVAWEGFVLCSSLDFMSVDDLGSKFLLV